MIQILFSLRFQAQLRRTRPVLYKTIENSITEAIKASRGILGFERRYITASFDEKSIGFWLDILTLVETIRKTMEDAASELYGYIAVLSRDLMDDTIQQFRLIASAEGDIWCEPRIRKALSVYGSFDPPLAEGKAHPAIAGYARLKNINIFPGGKKSGSESYFIYRERIQRTLWQEEKCNALLSGPRFIGKREGLRRYCSTFLEEAPPLIITFGAGGAGISCFADALTQPLSSFIGPRSSSEVMEELEALGSLIARDRFRNQHSGQMLFNAEKFLRLLCETYRGAVKQARLTPVIILENIHEAEAEAAMIFAGWYRGASGRPAFLVYGTCSDTFRTEPAVDNFNASIVPEPWTSIFPKVLQFPPGEFEPPPPPLLPADFYEVAYAAALLRQYFPSSRFTDLFMEAGINPRTAAVIMDFFVHRGLIDFREDPLPRIAGFIPMVEKLLGERKNYIRSIVLERILIWVDGKKINPCFNVLKILADLGGRGSDALILDSIMGDIINGTYREIDEVINTGTFETLTGESRAARLRYIAVTGKALYHGTEEDIRGAFLEAPPESETFPLYKLRILIGATEYHLSIRDSPSAQESAKEAMIMSQSIEKGNGLVQIYRLLSLVNVFQGRLGDALDYFNFAIEHAQRIGVQDELALAAYYAAGTMFLFGNISRAGDLARQAEAAALASGREDWADRAAFLWGRILFETGRYQEALNIFERLEDSSSRASNKAMLCSAWIFRTGVFLNHPAERLPSIMNNDSRLFAVEAAYLAGNYKEAIRLADALAAALPEENFFFVEQPDWNSGFSQCELLTSSMKDLFSRLLTAYRALALCRVKMPGAANKAAKNEARDCLRRILREENFPQIDPNDAFYYYAYYCVLGETGAMEVDMNTAVSLAFKRLQSRASRIDDLEMKKSFLSLNYWNNDLGQAARRHKLI
ncbi:MAG: hypothetical protein LBU18_02760 [Treponema sp.]|jgi:tetratricopeptide (TPR) repeat protein|nr:hypothetical protein [Treponema sp.]